VQDQNYMYKNKTSVHKAPLHNHMSIKKKLSQCLLRLACIFGNKSQQNPLQLSSWLQKEKVSLVIAPTASEF